VVGAEFAGCGSQKWRKGTHVKVTRCRLNSGGFRATDGQAGARWLFGDEVQDRLKSNANNARLYMV
jgi:hypothetical protein